MKGFYLIEDQQTCEITCPKNEGYYEYTDKDLNLFCLQCSADSCNDCPKDKCISCEFGTFLNTSNLCSGSCPDGYYKDNTVCTKCNISCKACTGPGNGLCTICNSNEGYFRYGSFCVN